MKPSAGHHERQPCVGQLQFGCVNRVGHPVSAFAVQGRLHTPAVARSQARRDPMKRMARGNLRLTPLVGEPAGAGAECYTCGRSIRAQPLEPGNVYPLERQGGLKSLFACRIELPGGLQCPFAVELGPVALKTQERRPIRPSVWPARFGAIRLLHPIAARLAERSWPDSLELPARKLNPLAVNDFRWCRSNHEISLGPGCDRVGHWNLELGIGNWEIRNEELEIGIRRPLRSPRGVVTRRTHKGRPRLRPPFVRAVKVPRYCCCCCCCVFVLIFSRRASTSAT
jgi:hypothetical protein